MQTALLLEKGVLPMVLDVLIVLLTIAQIIKEIEQLVKSLQVWMAHVLIHQLLHQLKVVLLDNVEIITMKLVKQLVIYGILLQLMELKNVFGMEI